MTPVVSVPGVHVLDTRCNGEALLRLTPAVVCLHTRSVESLLGPNQVGTDGVGATSRRHVPVVQEMEAGDAPLSGGRELADCGAGHRRFYPVTETTGSPPERHPVVQYCPHWAWDCSNCG